MKQGDRFINAIGVEVVAHGGSTPAVPTLQAPKSHESIAPEGFAVDVFGRVYEEEVPAFISTGTGFVIDRLHSPGQQKTRGGVSFRYLTFASLQKLADEKGHIWGPNELGIPPPWWVFANPQFNDDIGWGYGDGPSPYGPELGNDPAQMGDGWTQVGINSYQFDAPPGTQWQSLDFDVPKDTSYNMRFTVTVFEGVLEYAETIWRFDESSNDGKFDINRLGAYDFSFISPDGDPLSRFTHPGVLPWGTVRLRIEGVTIRAEGPPIYTDGLAITGPVDQPGWLEVEEGNWSGGDQFRYEWRRGGVDPVISTNDRLQTFFDDSEAMFTVDVWCSNPNGETGPERATITLDEFGALDTIGFDFSDFTTMFQDREGTIPVTQVGDRIARINGVGLTLLAPDNGDSRPTVVDVAGNGAAGHVAAMQQHLTTGAASSLIIDGNTVSLFYVFRFDGVNESSGAFSLGNDSFGDDWRQPQTCVTWQSNNTQTAAFYRGDSSQSPGDRPCIMETDAGLGELVMIEYHCSPTENRIFVNGIQTDNATFTDDNPTATPLQVDYVSTGARLQSAGTLALFGDVTFCEFQFAANMSLVDQEQLRTDLLTKWGLAP